MENCLNRLAMAFCLSRDLHRPEHFAEQLNCWKTVVVGGYRRLLSHNPFHINPTHFFLAIFMKPDPLLMQLEPTKAKKFYLSLAQIAVSI